MSEFECRVDELNKNSELNVIDKDKKDNVSKTGNTASFEKNTVSGKPDKDTNISTNTDSKTNNFIDKFLTEKNLKLVLLITVFYFFLHSDQVLEFINTRIPSLSCNSALNSAGKLTFGLLIGIVFIVSSFFFRDPWTNPWKLFYFQVFLKDYLSWMIPEYLFL